MAPALERDCWANLEVVKHPSDGVEELLPLSHLAQDERDRKSAAGARVEDARFQRDHARHVWLHELPRDDGRKRGEGRRGVGRDGEAGDTSVEGRDFGEMGQGGALAGVQELRLDVSGVARRKTYGTVQERRRVRMEEQQQLVLEHGRSLHSARSQVVIFDS